MKLTSEEKERMLELDDAMKEFDSSFVCHPDIERRNVVYGPDYELGKRYAYMNNIRDEINNRLMSDFGLLNKVHIFAYLEPKAEPVETYLKKREENPKYDRSKDKRYSTSKNEWRSIFNITGDDRYDGCHKQSMGNFVKSIGFTSTGEAVVKQLRDERQRIEDERKAKADKELKRAEKRREIMDLCQLIMGIFGMGVGIILSPWLYAFFLVACWLYCVRHL